MKRIAIILVVLLTLTCAPLTLRAQSGRNRGAGANKTSSNAAANDSSDEVINDAPINNGQGETVEGDVISVNTSLVTVPVNVMDRDGKYIPDLERKDFHIFEEGIEQRIAYFATVDKPFTVILVMDTSNSTHFRLEDIQSAAISFVNQLKEEDRVMVVSFDDKINVLTEATNDRDALTRAIRRTRTGGGTRLYDAVDFVIKQRLKNISGRKAVVLFTDGVDTTSRKATYESTVREAEELDAQIYPVDYDTRGDMGPGMGGPQIPFPGGRGGISIGLPFPRGPMPGGGGGPNSGDYRRAGAYLHELAQKTGGRFYSGDTLIGISEAFARIAEELRRQYSLGYYPKQAGQAGQRRQLKVRVNQPNLVVIARDSYIYTQKKPDATKSEEPQTTKPVAKENHLRATH
ncbi:MAG: VWA domain-containing protein [Pyrinomonadaceae bacterium]